MEILFILIAVLFLAYSNGSNDNFKGVATLYGSGTCSYRKALIWATVTTFLGSLTSVFLAATLIKIFSGKGFVPADIASSHSFILSVGLGASLCIFLASIFGWPVSTTHALIGALVGGGVSSYFLQGSELNLTILGGNFVIPLLVSPLISIALVAMLYPVFRYIRIKMGITKEMDICVGEKIVKTIPIPAGPGKAYLSNAALSADYPNGKALTIDLAPHETLMERYNGRFFGINSEKLLDAFHFLSGGLVSFARGLNDTPKILALLLAASAFQIEYGLISVGIAMAVGGIINGRKVANRMSHDITSMNHGQGFTANLVTGIVVIFASRIGVPVSTTHVSCGSLFALGIVNRSAKVKTILRILVAWVTTLPLAALLAAVIYYLT